MILGPPVHRGSTCSCTPFPKVLHRPSLARRLGCWAAVAAGVWRQQVRERCIQEDGWHRRVFGKRVLQSASSADSRLVIPALESFCGSLSVYVCDYLTALSRRCPSERERQRERERELPKLWRRRDRERESESLAHNPDERKSERER